MFHRFFALFLLGVGATVLCAQDAIQSGPAEKEFLPKNGSFDSFNINGSAKGRQHCVVCEFSQKPVVLIFSKESPGAIKGKLKTLLKNLDEAIETYQEDEFRSAIVFLSPDWRTTASDPAEEPSDKLVEQAKKRRDLLEKLEELAKDYNKVLVAVYPDEGPKDYALNPKAETTVILYERMKVVKNFAFDHPVNDADVDAIKKAVDDHMTSRRKK